MTDLSGNPAADLQVVQAFIEPSELTGKAASYWYPSIKQYYASWKAGSATSVTVDEGGGLGTVAYQYVGRNPGGGTETLIIRTEWVCIEGVWYRSIEDFGWEKGSGEWADNHNY